MQSTSRIPVLPTGVTAELLCDPTRNGPMIPILCKTAVNPSKIGADINFRMNNRTLLGEAQKSWLKKSLLKSKAKFKVIVLSVQILQWYGIPNDRWEGYWGERTEIIRFIKNNKLANVLFLVGDVHASIFSRVNPLGSPPIHEFTTGPVGGATLGTTLGPLAPIFVEFIYKYAADGHLISKKEDKPVKFCTIDTPNFMGVSFANNKLTIEAIDANGNVVVDNRGNVGRFELVAHE